ncbi:MAG: hypothetical protein ACPG61_03215 [Paracoccaceae bacterium]
MRHLWFSMVLAQALAAGSAQAQEVGSDKMRDGLDLFLDGLQEELAPALRGLSELADEAGPAMRQFLQEMGPAFADLLGEVQDWSLYHPPEILPNGDIIIRRRTAEPELEPEPEDEIEL